MDKKEFIKREELENELRNAFKNLTFKFTYSYTFHEIVPKKRENVKVYIYFILLKEKKNAYQKFSFLCVIDYFSKYFYHRKGYQVRNHDSHSTINTDGIEYHKNNTSFYCEREKFETFIQEIKKEVFDFVLECPF